MNTGEERKHRFFDPDEYTLINNRYFAAIRRNGMVELDPSGWIEAITQAKIVLPPELELPRSRYYMDEGNALGALRPILHRFLEIWDGKPLDGESFTVCPSVGIASLLTMAVLCRQGIHRIVFETPCYFAAILQAEWLGFEVVLMPTYRDNDYRWPNDFDGLAGKKPTLWWITQPRATLGFNQDPIFLRSLGERLGRRDYLVIDEAIDQSFPSVLGQSFGLDSRVVRLKGFGKPLGLNGYRLAFIIHGPQLREDMIDCLETFAGAVDAHSLEIARAVAEQPTHFAAMMRTANLQAVDLRIAAQKIAAGSKVTINPLVNGYLGSAVVDLSTLGSRQSERRHQFLLGCKRHGMPVIIGPSMHFASDPPTEAVRINFFGRREGILRSIVALGDVASGFPKQRKHDLANASNATSANGELKIDRKCRRDVRA